MVLAPLYRCAFEQRQVKASYGRTEKISYYAYSTKLIITNAESNRLVPLGAFCEFFVKKCCPLLTTLLSGSPIIQNGKLVGTVTHVLINDPATGYGIFIENMLSAAQMPMAKAS